MYVCMYEVKGRVLLRVTASQISSKIKLLQILSGCFIVSPYNMIRQSKFDVINCPVGQIVCFSLDIFCCGSLMCMFDFVCVVVFVKLLDAVSLYDVCHT